MRNAILSVMLVLVFGLPAYAQGVSGGVKGGVNFANLSFDPDEDEDLDSRIGLIAGGFVTMPIGSVFAIQPEVLYAQRGAKSEVEGGTGTLKLDYLEFPVLARIGSDAFNVFAGPSFNVKLNAEASFENDDDEEDSQDIDEEVKGSDVALVLGAAFGGRVFSIDVRATWGLTNINDDPDELAEVRNRSVAVMVGIRLK